MQAGPAATAQAVAFRDVYVARNVPYASDGLEMYAALCRFADSSLSRGILDFFSTAVTMLGGPVGGAIVKTGESLLTMSGNQNVCAFVYALTLALNIALSIALIPACGLWGAAIATTASMVFEAAALSFTVWRRLGIVMAILAPAGSRR